MLYMRFSFEIYTITTRRARILHSTHTGDGDDGKGLVGEGWQGGSPRFIRGNTISNSRIKTVNSSSAR